MHIHLRELTKQRGINSAKLADASGLSISTVNRILAKPNRNLSTTTLVKLSRALEVTIRELLGEDQ